MHDNNVGCVSRNEIVQLCYNRLNQAGLSPSDLSSDGLRLLVWCAIRDRLAAAARRD